MNFKAVAKIAAPMIIKTALVTVVIVVAVKVAEGVALRAIAEDEN